MSLTIKEVLNKESDRDFIDLPWDLHGNNPIWVPPLKIAVKEILDPKKNPFFKHAKMKRWVAYRDGVRVGRMAGTIDENHNQFHEEKAAFWGFFECIDDLEVAKILFAEVEKWAKLNGMLVLRGPMNPSTNHECGLQISAFETTPFVMMTQNPAYYQNLVEKVGNTKAKDLYAWILDNTATFDPKIVRRADRLANSNDIVIRTVNMKKYDEEIEKILTVYNDAWEKNWGFVPLTDEEFRHAAKEMKMILDPRLLFIVEVKGEVAGFSLFLPDINQVFQRIRNGKLFPTGLIKLLYFLKIKKVINRGRVVTLGIRKKFQPLGLGAMLYMKYLREIGDTGYPVGECSWILEDNFPMNRALELMKAKHYKTYRIYDKSL